ncbi:hypothetical protein FJY84_03125 [Candidatus Bathyarchaeota archaeon]|nr:hypothetical protein [Candidatus Bathyarchaeota archaeon]
MEKRSAVSREAARLLYNGLVKEYIQAKEIAATNLGTTILPSNYEIALELDKLADEVEGSKRQNNLIKMREIAKKIMTELSVFQPRLIGSVWRGTIKQGSDIDLIVLASDPIPVGEILKKYELIEKGNVAFKNGINVYHYKIWFERFPIEVVVRQPSEYQIEKCDIFGDKKTGLSLNELEKLLNVDPLRRFIPKRRIK